MASPLDPTESEIFNFEKRRNSDRRRITTDLNYLDNLRSSARGKNWALNAIPATLLGWTFMSYALRPDMIGVLDYVSVFVHRMGHTIWGTLMSNTGYYMGGIFFQLMIPLALVEFFRRRSNPFHTAVACGFLCTNFLWLSRYVEGAQDGTFPRGLGQELLHDWQFILETLGMLQFSGNIAWLMHAGAMLALGACMYSMVYQLYYMVALEERRVGSRRKVAKRTEGTEKDLLLARRPDSF